MARCSAGTPACREETTSVLEYDNSWLGKEFDRYSYSVSKEEIVAFAQSIGDTNPLYTDEAYAKTTPYGGLIAPPTFCVVFRSYARLPELKLNYGKRGFDGGKECTLDRKSTRLNSSHGSISYAVFCLKKKTTNI